MDDLRDYRFYDDDMLHPSNMAVNYIWDKFTGCYLDSKTMNTWNEVVKITRACNHSLKDDSDFKTSYFAERMLKRISEIEGKVPAIDLSFERNYFLGLHKR